MTRTLRDSLVWTSAGTNLLADAIAGLDHASYGEPSGLPCWSRGHLVAHLAANAEAVGNLVHWAATGEETPMYRSPAERAAGIERGSQLGAEELAEWYATSSAALDREMATLADEHWNRRVVTAQGRTVQASETPWMRAREVMVHAVDLGTGITFRDLPADFLVALRDDIIGKRGRSSVPDVAGGLADIVAWLAGRPYDNVTTPYGAPAAPLGPWL